MNTRFVNSLLSLLALILITGCAKDNKTEEDPTAGGNGTVNTGFFSWTAGGGSTSSANEFYYVSAFNNIVGKKLSNGSYVDITLDNLAVGNYNISPSKGILFEYYDGTQTFTGTSGIIQITANTGTLISGNFTAVLSNSIVTSISGQFSEVPEK